jgi:hypothetical protein
MTGVGVTLVGEMGAGTDCNGFLTNGEVYRMRCGTEPGGTRNDGTLQ